MAIEWNKNSCKPQKYCVFLLNSKLYHELKLHKDISSKYKFNFNLDSILSRLVYGKIIFPTSKLDTYQLAQTFLEQPEFEIQHIYRALEVISKETDFIQSELYKKKLALDTTGWHLAPPPKNIPKSNQGYGFRKESNLLI